MILDYLTHQRRLLPRLAATYALDFALKHLAKLYAKSPADDRREVEGLAAGLKALALWRIESDRGFFLEHGYFDGATAKAIRNLVNRLCREVRGQALPLVDAFGIPNALLGAPIAT